MVRKVDMIETMLNCHGDILPGIVHVAGFKKVDKFN